MIDKNTFLPGKFYNRGKLLVSFLKKSEVADGLPLEVGIEITNRCNLSCIMCPHPEMVAQKIRPQGTMDFALFKKIVDEISSFAELVYLHGLGEPLLHPNFFEFVEYAKGKGLRVGISTNATLLNKNNARALLESSIDYVILAVDGATKETYEKIRVGANFALVEENIKNFLNYKKRYKKPPFVVIQFITMDENEREVGPFLKKWQGKGASVVRIKQKIALKDADKNDKRNTPDYCFHIFRQLNINWDGTVVPCCEDVYGRYPLGNIKNEKITDIWNNKKMTILRKANFQKNRNKIGLCRTCHYPQPSMIETVGVMLLDHLTIKKILPRLERL